MKKSLITSGQKEQVVRVATDAFRKGMESAVDELVRTEAINTSNLQRVLAQGGTLAKHLVAEAKKKMTELAEQVVGYLKLISGDDVLTIGATDGKGTIAKAKDLFTGWIDSDFVNYGTDVKGKPTEEASAQVFEMIKDGTFAQIFGGFGENLDRLCLSQDQIISFVRNHTKWLRADGYGTFFLFKVGDEFFVAYVYWNEVRLEVRAHRLSDDYAWLGGHGHRLVVPQL
jgi:hypothetical protein